MQDSLYPSGRESDQGADEVIESRLNGAFKGCTGRTRFALLNGQVWEQQSFGVFYHYAYMPRVAIMRSSDGYIMRLEGVPKMIRVRRVA